MIRTQLGSVVSGDCIADSPFSEPPNAFFQVSPCLKFRIGHRSHRYVG